MVEKDGNNDFFLCANDNVCKYMFAIDITNGCFFFVQFAFVVLLYVVVISEGLANFLSFIILDQVRDCKCTLRWSASALWGEGCEQCGELKTRHA